MLNSMTMLEYRNRTLSTFHIAISIVDLRFTCFSVEKVHV